MKGVIITYYDNQGEHKAGPFRSVMLEYITQTIPAGNSTTTATYYCETEDSSKHVTIPLTHSIEAAE